MTNAQLIDLLQGTSFGIAEIFVKNYCVTLEGDSYQDLVAIDGISFDAVTNTVYIDINIPR